MLKRKLKLGVVIGLVMTLVLIVLAGCAGPAGPAGPAGAAGPAGTGKLVFEKPTAPELTGGVVEATYTTVIPNLDGVIDPVWARATELKVIVGGSFLDVASTGSEVTLKFLYSDENIYMLAQYPDPTYSLVRYDAWGWDGAKWSTVGYSEEGLAEPRAPGATTAASWETPLDDAFSVTWDINSPDFEEVGCLSHCHSQWLDQGLVITPPAHYEGEACRKCHDDDVFVEAPDESVWDIQGGFLDQEWAIEDMWYLATNSLLPGHYAYDYYWIYDADFPPRSRHGGRANDDDAYTISLSNIRDRGPKYMETDPRDYDDAMVLTASEVAMGEAVLVAGLTVEQIDQYWAVYERQTAKGKVTNYPHAFVPPRLIDDFIELVPMEKRGSSDDVLAAAQWQDGIWTFELARKLVNGNYDDVQFDDFTKVYPFNIAAFDNTAALGHVWAEGAPLYLVFVPPPTE